MIICFGVCDESESPLSRTPKEVVIKENLAWISLPNLLKLQINYFIT